MSSRAHKRPEPCGEENCGSRRFHVGDDGYTYCDRGHQQSHRGTVIAEDTGELVQLGRKQRRRDSDAESSARSRSRGFTGSKALEHYLLALQLVLRKQVEWLVSVANLPAELEAITRDIWALRLRRLQSRVSYDSETDTEAPSQVFSSQSENDSAASRGGGGGGGGGSSIGRRRSKRHVKTDGAVNLAETLAILHVSAALLRIPLTIADIVDKIDTGELLYYSAARAVPATLLERLPPEFQGLLEPQRQLRCSALHKRALELAALLGGEFGMEPPRANVPLLLYRWMGELALPIEVYAATRRLARELGADFTVQVGEGKAGSPVLLRYPEVQLMALLVVATKLFFPLDDVERHPTSAQDLSALEMDWDAWAATHNVSSSSAERDNTSRGLRFSEAASVSESDCTTMGEAELDRYLDWYETNLASESVREQGRAGRDADFRRTLMRLFPTAPSRGPPVEGEDSVGGEDNSLERSSADEATQRLRRVQQALRPRKIVVSAGNVSGGVGGVEQGKVARAGSFYRRHREAADLEGPTRTLYAKAATLAGVALEEMTRAVFLTERKLQKREQRGARDEDAGEE